MEQSKVPEQKNVQPPDTQRKPNDQGKIIVQAHIKIHDPETKTVFVEGRA
jgi:hypothetical protein